MTQVFGRGCYKIPNRNCLKEKLKEKEKSVAGPRWAIVGRNVTLTLTWILGRTPAVSVVSHQEL
jgi:hypothetical protein